MPFDSRKIRILLFCLSLFFFLSILKCCSLLNFCLYIVIKTRRRVQLFFILFLLTWSLKDLLRLFIFTFNSFHSSKKRFNFFFTSRLYYLVFWVINVRCFKYVFMRFYFFKKNFDKKKTQKKKRIVQSSNTFDQCLENKM